jgi:hypothetical protein
VNTVTQIVVTVISSGFGAGIVTFTLNSIKGERDFLRSKLETLYLAVHKYTLLSTSVSDLVMRNQLELLQKEVTDEDFEPEGQLVVIIDLYFPQLRPQYDEFKKLVSETVFVDAAGKELGTELNLSDLKHKAKYQRVCEEARKFEKAIVEMSRSHSLLSWTY